MGDDPSTRPPWMRPQCGPVERIERVGVHLIREAVHVHVDVILIIIEITERVAAHAAGRGEEWESSHHRPLVSGP